MAPARTEAYGGVGDLEVDPALGAGLHGDVFGELLAGEDAQQERPTDHAPGQLQHVVAVSGEGGIRPPDSILLAAIYPYLRDRYLKICILELAFY